MASGVKVHFAKSAPMHRADDYSLNRPDQTHPSILIAQSVAALTRLDNDHRRHPGFVLALLPEWG